MPYADAVDIVKEALGKGQIMYRIKNIGFADTVITDKTVYSWWEFKLSAVVILEVGESEFFEVHIQRHNGTTVQRYNGCKVMKRIVKWFW